MKINNKKCKDILELINIAEEKFSDDVNIDLSEDNINININLKENDNVITAKNVLAKKKSFNDYTWKEIDKISKSGKAREYFNIEDEKELIINEFCYKIYDEKLKKKVTKLHPKTTYHVQIIGFNHDYKSDRTGKAGITICLKNAMTTTYNINSIMTNIGGWKESKIRTFLNNDIYNALPSDLQSVIKTVKKISDTGKNTKFYFHGTNDKLFLLSSTEVGLDSNINKNKQGSKYQYFTSNSSRKKCLNGCPTWWWLRSTYINDNKSFCFVGSCGDGNYCDADCYYGVVFAFCI